MKFFFSLLFCFTFYTDRDAREHFKQSVMQMNEPIVYLWVAVFLHSFFLSRSRSFVQSLVFIMHDRKRNDDAIYTLLVLTLVNVMPCWWLNWTFQSSLYLETIWFHRWFHRKCVMCILYFGHESLLYGCNETMIPKWVNIELQSYKLHWFFSSDMDLFCFFFRNFQCYNNTPSFDGFMRKNLSNFCAVPLAYRFSVLDFSGWHQTDMPTCA